MNDLLWIIRKINWCRISRVNNQSRLNILKMNRSIEINLNKIIRTKIDINKKQYFLADFKFIGKLFSTQLKDIFISCYSEFLANNNSLGISIELSRNQFLYFNYLFPGDGSMDEKVAQEIKDPFFRECKNDIEVFEKLIVKSSIRLLTAQKKDASKLYPFLNLLESRPKV
jgi:hypothetical protein